MLQRIPQDRGELLLLQEPMMDFATGMLRNVWTFIRPDGMTSTASHSTGRAGA